MARGFTLLELLFVMAIILILASLAVPHYNDYRARAYDSRALSDLRNVATAQEAYFIDEEEYLSCTDQGCAELPGIARISSGVRISMTAAETEFTGEADHEKGSGRLFRWDSAEGGIVP